MNPIETGKRYDAIANNWDEELKDSSYGTEALMRAIRYCEKQDQRKIALDIGCGSGGRMIRLLEAHNFQVTGIDISENMLVLAHAHHPLAALLHADICTWTTSERFDLILAWDSIFHVPYSEQESVMIKIYSMLKPGGIALFTFGDAVGEHESEWHAMNFYYSSLGIAENVRIMHEHECTLKHLELDQFPLNHVACIVQKNV